MSSRSSSRRRREAAEKANLRYTGLPLVYCFWTGVAALIGGTLLNVFAPDVLASIGGWVTVVAVLVASVTVGILARNRRLRRVHAGFQA